MKVKVKVPFYSTELGSCKVGDVLEVLSASDLSGLVDVLPDDKPKAAKKETSKKAKQE